MNSPVSRKLICTLGFVTGLLWLTPAIGEPTHLFNWGRVAESAPGAFGTTTGIAVNSVTGDVYVVGGGDHRLQRFDGDGNFIGAWACRDCDSLDVNETTGNIYVGEKKSHVVIEFSPMGEEIRRWGGLGSGDGQFNKPRNVAVDSSTGNVFVVDVLNARVQVFDSAGNFLRKWGTQGTGDGQFSGIWSPMAPAFDPATRILYVSDPRYNIVQKFDEFGNFLGKWGGSWGVSLGQTRWIRDIAVAANGNLYLADADNERIQIFTPDGSPVDEFQGPHNIANGPFHPRAIAINRNTGEKYVAAAYARRVDMFSANNLYIKSWGYRERDGEVLLLPLGVSVSPVTGEVYVTDTKNFMIKRFSARGVFLNQWGASSRLEAPPGDGGEGLFGFGDNAITVDQSGDVWVANSLTPYQDPLVRFVQRFSSNGDFLASWSSVDPKAKDKRGIVVDYARNRVFISEPIQDRVRIFDLNGSVVQDIVGLGGPAGLALNNDNTLFVIESTCQCISKYDGDGVFLKRWEGPDSFSFKLFSGATTDLLGNIYAVDSGKNRIQVFDSDGTFLHSIGTNNYNAGKFNGPADVTVSRAYDTLYIADKHNDRIQAFLLNSVSNPDIRGIPNYLPGSALGVYMWKNFFDAPYHLRVSGNGIVSGSTTTYNVNVVASESLLNVQTVNLETTDDTLSVQSSGFELSGNATSSEDGLDFTLAPQAEALIGIKLGAVSDPKQLHIGVTGEPLVPAGWVLPYQDLPTIPGFTGGQDLGLFIGKGQTADTLQARWNGEGNRIFTEFSLYASESFVSKNPVHFETNGDYIVLDTPSGLGIESYVSNFWDGVDVSLPQGNINVGITYKQNSLSGLLYVNYGNGGLGVPNAYRLPVMEPYGEPSYVPLNEAGIYLWKDRKDGIWHMRATAGGSWMRYTGTISADMSASFITPFKLETSDILDTSDPANIKFDFRMSNGWQDGADFQFPKGANISLQVDVPADVIPMVHIGARMWPIENLPLQLGGW